MAAPSASLHPPQLVLGFGLRRHIFAVDRLGLQLLGKLEQTLRHISARRQPIGSRPVIPLLITLQFQLQPEVLQVEFLGTASLLFGPRNSTCRTSGCNWN